MKIIVIGAGSWGTGLAVAAAGATRADGSRRNEVCLWARDTAQARAMRASRGNARYLPGVVLPEALDIIDDGAAALPGFAHLARQCGLVVVATPLSALRPLLRALAGCPAPVAWLCKGFEQAGSSLGLLANEIQAQVAPDLIAGVLSGPSFAQEVALGQPTALVAASRHALARDAMVEAFHGPTLRVYGNDDIVGVEVGGAVKNVLAIATGLCDGLGLGLNARAALVTRGLAEMTRLGMALGARPETFMGLSGLGDLVLTATGDLSRNRKVGLALAQGQTQQQAVESLGHVAEGVYSARTVAQRAQALGVDMPITRAVVALLDGQTNPSEAVKALMERDARPES
jgi:glycerol-3-phosphate dehydrogenase (NAD(P)+)